MMEKDDTTLQPVFSHAEPVFPVNNLVETIAYWQEVLGFPVKWTWGEPPELGAVSWQKVHVQFYQNPELAAASTGNSVWIRLQHIEALYRFHQQKGANIVAPLENKPWGMAQYTIREINGYLLHFAGVLTEREKSKSTASGSIQIVERSPSITEYRALASAVGWSPSDNDDVIQAITGAAIFAVVAKDSLSGETIGSALLLGDHASFYYVKDVMVRPDWQGRQVGTALMRALTVWLEKNGAGNALVGLITGEGLEPFYQQFGFTQAFSMLRYIDRREVSND